MGESGNDKKEAKEDLSKSRRTIEEGRLRLAKLRSDGLELVTNVRVAGDARENSRRMEDDEARRLRKEKLDAEAKAGQERFDEITKKWATSLQKEIPQDLYEMFKIQRDACTTMMEEKAKLIADLEAELKLKDDQYVKDLKKQSDDIDLMIERMDEQVKNLTKEYRSELNKIEKAFETERRELAEQHKKKWESLMAARREKEAEYMRQRERRVDDYEKQLQHMRVQDAEEYNQLKIKLETDVQILEQQLQQMRATYQLNQEKLEYNFQVLKKRDEENTITKSQQKRKITRLQDVLNNLKIKLRKQEQQYQQENAQLTEDYKRITEQFRDLQKKSKHFMAADAKKFEDVWIMNEQEAKDLLFSVVEQDRLIHEQQLGLPYAQPDLVFAENVGPIISEATRRKALPASTVIQEVMSAHDEEEAGDVGSHKRSLILQKFSPGTIKKILELLCDESGFLVESKLLKLIAPLQQDEQSLMKLDAIFAALNIDTEEDVFRLASYFTKATRAGSSPAAAASVTTPLYEDTVQDRSAAADQRLTGAARVGSASLHSEYEEAEGELEEIEEDGASALSSASHGVPDLVHPNDVLTALRHFVEDSRKMMPFMQAKQPQFRINTEEGRDNADDAAYWKRYVSVITENKLKLWDALLGGLEKYSEYLTSRVTLLNETDAMRQQNGELRMLLHQYINSKVNKELEIPPTRVLQLDVQPMR